MSRVLIAEDGHFQALAIGALLEDAGFTVEIAPDGVAALECLGRSEYDAVVTDLIMPRMDGLGLVEAIRREHGGLPVILMTAHGSEEIAARALRAGAASYVPKKHLGDDLIPTLTGVLAIAGADPANKRLHSCLERTELEFVLENDPALVAPLIGEVQRSITQSGLRDRTNLLRIGVALREAVVNAIEHGNLEADSELRQDDERIYRRVVEERRGQRPYSTRRVHFRAVISRAEAVITVRDEGPGFDVTALPDPTDPAQLERVGGRGLLLMRTFMDEVYHHPSGNEITLIKRTQATAPRSFARVGATWDTARSTAPIGAGSAA